LFSSTLALTGCLAKVTLCFSYGAAASAATTFYLGGTVLALAAVCCTGVSTGLADGISY